MRKMLHKRLDVHLPCCAEKEGTIGQVSTGAGVADIRVIKQIKAAYGEGIGSSSDLVEGGGALATRSTAPPPTLHRNPSIWQEDCSIMHSLDQDIPLYLDAYFSHIWPLAPVVDRSRILGRFAHREHLMDQQFAALLLASASLSLMVPTCRHLGTEESAEKMMREALRLHNTASLGEPAKTSLDSVVTSMLMGAFSRAKGWNDASYLRTKESLSLVEMLNLHQEKGYEGLTASDKECAKVLYQTLRCAERSNALVERRSISFRTPIVFDSGPRAEVPPIVALFDCVDSQTIDCINGFCTGSTGGCSLDAYKAIIMHTQLDAVRPSVAELDVQQADMAITRIFLHTNIWQACVSHSILAFGTPFIELQPEYPFSMLARLVESIRSFSDSALGGNGRCLSKKIAYILDTAEMVLRLPVRPPLPPEIGSAEECGLLLAEMRAVVDRLAATRWMRVVSPAASIQSIDAGDVCS